MDTGTVITLKNISESYDIDFVYNGKVKKDRIVAANNVNLTIKKGECLAIVGANGAGKTTILKLIAGIIKPDSGEINISGRVACLLDLGVGFDPSATGRENIFLLARLYGIQEKYIESRLEQIIEFSGIGRFIDAPLRSYSAGMYVRLAFSLAIHVDPDILLIDDCLVVGDEGFQKKCIEKIFELKQNSKTIIFVTHDINLALMLGSRGIFLKDGQVLYDGSIEKTLVYYTQMVGDINGIGMLEKAHLSVVFNNGKLYLNWKNIPLSKGLGGGAIILSPKRQIFSKDMLWRIESLDNLSLVARGRDVDLGLNQIWKITLTEENYLNWQIETETPAGSGFYLNQINLMLSEKFNQWSALSEQGIFPKHSSTFREWQVLESPKPNPVTSGLISAYYEDGKAMDQMPGVVLESLNDTGFKIGKAIITGIDLSAKVISLFSSSLENQNLFSGRIRIFENKQELINYIDFRKLELEKGHTIQRDDLRLFFDSGCLRLFYKEIELTKASGLFSSFYSGKRWFNSSEAVWECRRQDSSTLILKVNWPQAKIFHTWEIFLSEGNLISWKISMHAEDVYITAHRCGVLLLEKYQKWFSTYEEGDFPQEFSNQNIILENNEKKEVGVKNVDSYPGLMFCVSSDTANCVPEIQNTDALFKARVLSCLNMLTKDKNYICAANDSCKYFSGTLKICPNPMPIEKYLADNKRNKLEADLSKQAELAQAQIIQDGKVKVIFDPSMMRIFYNELEVTGGCGLRTLFKVQDINKEFNSEDAKWQINKISKDRMVCYLRWDDMPGVIQRWEVKVEGRDVKLLIAISASENLNIFNERAGILLSKKYRLWLTDAGERGEIDYSFTERIRGVPIKNNKTKKVSVRKSTEGGLLYPNVIFNSFADNGLEVSSIALDKEEGLAAYFLKVDQNKSISSTPGEYIFFEGSIILDMDEKGYEALSRGKEEVVFYLPTLKPLDAFISNGTIKLYWKGKPVTKGLGVYTSFCSSGQWYDSSQAVWRIEKESDNVTRASARWPWLPIIQYWDIKTDKKRLFLEINNQIYRGFCLDAEETNLLLNDEYSGWFVGKKQGSFYEEFSKNDLFRFRIWISKVSEECIGVKKKIFNLPSVSLKPLLREENGYIVLENADILGEKGRLIQYIKIYNKVTGSKKPEKYKSFQGMIELC